MPKSHTIRRQLAAVAASLGLFFSHQAVTAPAAPRDLSKEALRGHLRTSDADRITHALEKSRSDIDSDNVRAPNKRIQATVIFNEGVSREQLANLAKQFSFDITHTDAKVPVSSTGEVFTVLTFHAREPAASMAARLRASELNVRADIESAANRTVQQNPAAVNRNFVQTRAAAVVPEMRYYAASVIGSVRNLAILRRDSNVMSVVVDNDAEAEVTKIDRDRSEAKFDALRAARVLKFAEKEKKKAAETTGRATRLMTGAAKAQVTTLSGGAGPALPGWVHPHETESVTGEDPELSKINLYPDSHYTNCVGSGCPNNWAWTPRQNRLWYVGIKRYSGGCYLVPSFYYEWDEYDDTMDDYGWYYVEVCYSPLTEGYIVSQFKFGTVTKLIPIVGLANLPLASYHNEDSLDCNPSLMGEGGITALEWPCSSSDVNAVYVPNSTFEDETKIPNPNCPGTTRPMSGRMNHPSCYEVYQAWSNMPAAYFDTMFADAVTEFNPTIGSADAELFHRDPTYLNVVYFAANSVQPVAGLEARHEFEIGTSWPHPSCAPWCIFKVKENTVGQKNMVPIAPGTFGVVDVASKSARAVWEKAGAEDEVQRYEWRINGGAWSSAATPPVVLSGLTPSTNYVIEVRAVDSAGLPGGISTTSFTTSPISISNRSVSVTGSPGSYVTQAAYTLKNTGDIFATNANGSNQVDVGDWITPKSGMANYQVRKSGGSCSAGPPTGQWIALTNTVSWLAIAGGTPHASQSCSLTLEISAIANPSLILGTATISLSASH